MFYGHPDDDTHLATPGEACREYARNAGVESPEYAWILTPWDTWEKNPAYHGPAVPHPELYDPDEEGCEPPGFDDHDGAATERQNDRARSEPEPEYDFEDEVPF